MYYFAKETIVNAFDALKGKVENKFFGLLGILKAINSDAIVPNVTYRIIDGGLSSWLDNQFFLSIYQGTYSTSDLYVRFSEKWIGYVEDKFFKETINVYNLIVFLYKYECFDSEPSCYDLLVRFCEDYHLSQDIIDRWFEQTEIVLEYDNNQMTPLQCKDYLGVSNNTLSFDKPYSVSARAGELSRAPFLQTLYAGMDSIKCLLVLRENLDDYYYCRKKHNERQGVSSINQLYRPYITAIKSKPFLLLAGISGTGKSRIVRELARACWDVDSEEYKAHKPKNYEMVQVKPNWHDSSELIGYVSRINGEQFVVGPFLRFMVKAIKDPIHPYFLCLDEMNLAPVEQYFAEFLSVIESRKLEDGVVVTDPIVDYEPTEAYISLINQLFGDDPEKSEYLKAENGKRLSIPQNLIVVGTVNMDETTFSFSRKVLDRAMTIEMNEVDLYGGLTDRHEKVGKLEYADLIGTCVEGVDVYQDNQAVCDKVISYLQSVNAVLEGTPFKIAYRTRNEFLLYVVNNLPYRKDEADQEMTEDAVIARALDEITSMKILSRIEGDDSKVKADWLQELETKIGEGLTAISGLTYTSSTNINKEEGELDDATVLSISLAKLKEMEKRLESGYTSFWS